MTTNQSKIWRGFKITTNHEGDLMMTTNSGPLMVPVTSQKLAEAEVFY